MEKVEVKYIFKYSEVWDEDQELKDKKEPLIENNKDGYYTFIMFPPTEESIKEHIEVTLNNLIKEGKIDYYKVQSIKWIRPNGFRMLMPFESLLNN